MLSEVAQVAQEGKVRILSNDLIPSRVCDRSGRLQIIGEVGGEHVELHQLLSRMPKRITASWRGRRSLHPGEVPVHLLPPARPAGAYRRRRDRRGRRGCRCAYGAHRLEEQQGGVPAVRARRPLESLRERGRARCAALLAKHAGQTHGDQRTPLTMQRRHSAPVRACSCPKGQIYG